MAGSYPDVPGYRFAYDLDGTIAIVHMVNQGTNRQFTSSELRILNNDTAANAVNLTTYGSAFISGFFALLFPEPRSINGVFFNRLISTSSDIQWSNDSTNGIDGTWQTEVGLTAGFSNDKINTRNNISNLTIPNVQSIRIPIGYNYEYYYLHNLHIYGTVAPIESPDRLRIVDLTDQDIAAQLDFGNIPQRNSVTKQFKVTNNSSTKTASSITVSLDAPADANPSLIGQYQISNDNTAFANAINVGTLAPGASTGTLYLRNSIASNAQVSIWSARIIAHPTSWS